MNCKIYLLLILSVFSLLPLIAQDDLEDLFDDTEDLNQKVSATFKTSRLINAHTIEQPKAGELDFRITHRFGDLVGDFGGAETFFGLDEVSDVRIALEYGITDRLTVGLGRSKGGFTTGPKQVYDAHLKAKILQQSTSNQTPISVSVFTSADYSTQKKSENSSSIASFPESVHRLSYVTQLIIARKFSKNLSLEFLPTYLHRNYVLDQDENQNFALGIGGRIKLAKRVAVIFDYTYLFSEYREQAFLNKDLVQYYNPLGLGIEIETGGHVFHLNFSNSAGIIESQFIPYTNKDWMSGGFRFGFNISRIFTVVR